MQPEHEDAAPTAPPVPARADDAPVSDGPRLMVAEVVPVWKRHVDASRVAVEDGVCRLLETFSQLCDGVTQVSRQADETVAPMSAGAWTQRRDVILGDLIDQVDRARQHRERLLSQFSEGLLQLEDIERSLREASLGAGADPDVVDGLQRLDSTRHSLAALSRQVAADLRSDHVQHDAARSQAAQAIDRLLADSLPTNAGAMADTIRSLSTRIERDLEQVLVGLQFQDRMSQMLHGVAADMQRFIEWMASNEHATHADAMRWLTQLEHSYTMREQQLLHDGNSGEGSPPAPSGIEFF